MIRYPGQSPLFAGVVEHGGLLATSGVVAPAALSGRTMPFDHEVTSALDELRSLLWRAGSALDDVIRIEAFLADPADFPSWNDSFLEYWPQLGHRPARTTLVAGFALPTIRFEIQALAARTRDTDDLATL